ncbi:UDP-N-acetylglucosamine 1-carboxyvinyltransferase [Candidatus Curtissbacteria bacterium]|nr:UDP-N-acetylglucosamine 1-carboxyvinyltransferase [Candidatus Curtissbacteria bacterium]
MARFEIIGPSKLSGKIRVAGSKNSVLPIMAASLLTEEECTIENVPKISDVAVMAQLLEICGAGVKGIGTATLTITAKKLTEQSLPRELTEKLRASILLLGPLIARVGKVTMGFPGGDIIGRRSLDTHVQALKSFGVKIEEVNDRITAYADELGGTWVFLQEASVTATENAVMAAVLTKGETVIKRAASEPHVVDLCNFLIKMGANIDGVASNVLKIRGVEKLTGTSFKIRPDHIEAGTFAILAAVTGSSVEISPVAKEDLDMILLILEQFGVRFSLEENTLKITGGKLKAVEKVVTDVWPGFPTDLMAPMIVLATQAQGATLLHDWMYESRMFFVDKLLSMGAKVEIADPHRVLVYGPTKLRGQRLDTPDIRAGMALVIAALAARGKSIIDKAELIERGYEDIVERLSTLGAKITKRA